MIVVHNCKEVIDEETLQHVWASQARALLALLTDHMEPAATRSNSRRWNDHEHDHDCAALAYDNGYAPHQRPQVTGIYARGTMQSTKVGGDCQRLWVERRVFGTTLHDTTLHHAGGRRHRAAAPPRHRGSCVLTAISGESGT